MNKEKILVIFDEAYTGEVTTNIAGQPCQRQEYYFTKEEEQAIRTALTQAAEIERGDKVVEVELQDGDINKDIAKLFNWSHADYVCKILRYERGRLARMAHRPYTKQGLSPLKMRNESKTRTLNCSNVQRAQSVNPPQSCAGK